MGKKLSHTAATQNNAFVFKPVPASAKVEGNQPKAKGSAQDAAPARLVNVRAATLAEILGFNPKRGESCSPPVFKISDARCGDLLALSQEDVELLPRNDRREFEQALLMVPADRLNSWQYEERERLDRRAHGALHDHVLRDSSECSSRRSDMLGGAFAFG